MAGLAGIIYRKKSNNGSADEKRRIYKSSVEKMLGNISHRGSRSRALTFMDNKDFAAVTGFISNYDVEDNPGTGHPGSKAFNSNVMLDGKIYNTDEIYFNHKKGKASLTDENRMLEEIVTGFDSNIIKKLDGQFAMVLNDRNKNIYLLRDFLGRKPLYFGYSDDNDTLFFASEVKAMAMFCSDVNELAPGHFIKNNQSPVMFRELDFKKYQEKFKNETSFRAQQEYDDTAEINNIVDRIEDLLLKSIEKRIPSGPVNIKIGAWLSGGLDSSIIAALLKHFKQDIYTFAVGFKGSRDLEAAKVVSDYLQTKHKEYIFEKDELFGRVPETIFTLESFDAPLVRSTLGNIIASKMSSGADIVFSGEGGDEIFAGYNYFLEYNSQIQIQEGLLQAIDSLHNTALQRVDRSSNSHGVNVKLPMLDEELIDYVLHIPPKYKLDYNTGLTKCILRNLADRYLPQEIVWRPKDKFWEGSGINDSLENKINGIITDSEFEKEKIIDERFTLRNKEELYYYKIFKNCYPEVEFNNFLSFTDNFN